MADNGQDNVFYIWYNLANEVKRWRAFLDVMRRCVSTRIRLIRRDESSGASLWPVGRDSLTGQSAFAYACTMQDE